MASSSFTPVLGRTPEENQYRIEDDPGDRQSVMPRNPDAHRFRSARVLALLFAAGLLGVAMPLLLGTGLHRAVVWLTGGRP